MKTVVTVLGGVILVLIIVWLALQFRTKSKYDRVRLAGDVGYPVIVMDQEAIAFLSEVQSTWTCSGDITNGPDSQMLNELGKSPSVRSLIETFRYQMPAYRWFAPSRNRQAAALLLAKVEFMPVSIDKRWHVSADEHTAFLLCESNGVAVYRDVPGGLRTSHYVKDKSLAMHDNAPRALRAVNLTSQGMTIMTKGIDGD